MGGFRGWKMTFVQNQSFTTADHLRAEGVFKYDEILKKLVKKNNSSKKNILSKMCPVNFLP